MKFPNLFIQKPFLVVLALTILIPLAGCKNPAGSDEEEHHHRAVGAILKVDGTEIARSEEGNVSGSIEVSAGEESRLITLYFLDEDGHEFQPEEPHFTLNWRGIDPSTAEVEQHEDGGKWSFHIHGIASGQTSVVLQLWHKEAEHADAETAAIPVTVH